MAFDLCYNRAETVCWLHYTAPSLKCEWSFGTKRELARYNPTPEAIQAGQAAVGQVARAGGPRHIPSLRWGEG
jgi:hypothetical protein